MLGRSVCYPLWHYRANFSAAWGCQYTRKGLKSLFRCYQSDRNVNLKLTVTNFVKNISAYGTKYRSYYDLRLTSTWKIVTILEFNARLWTQHIHQDIDATGSEIKSTFYELRTWHSSEMQWHTALKRGTSMYGRAHWLHLQGWSVQSHRVFCPLPLHSFEASHCVSLIQRNKLKIQKISSSTATVSVSLLTVS